MITMEQVNKVLSRIKAFLPEALPQGLTAFNAWSTEVISLANVPDNDSTRFALAVMILHLPPQCSRKAKEYFIRSLRKSAANEVAASVAQELKNKQQAAMAKSAEATARLQVASDGPTQ